MATETTSLSLTAKDVMTTEPVCVEPSTTIRQLAGVFNENDISGAPVIDGQGRAIGMVSKTDLIRRCIEGIDHDASTYLFELLGEHDTGRAELTSESHICVEDFMTPDPVMVSPETSVSTVAALMFQQRIHRVIVADEDNVPMGIISSLDLLRIFPQESGSAARSFRARKGKARK